MTARNTAPGTPAAGRKAARALGQSAHMAIGVALAAPLIAAGPAHAQAQSAGVKALVDQAHYWEGKGRHDLATQAWHRVLELDPANPAAHHALAAPAAAPPAPAFAQSAPAPRARRHPRPAAMASADAAPPAAAPAAPASAAPAVAPATATAPAAPPAPRRAAKSAADLAGIARMTGFRALQDNNLDDAARQFHIALARNHADPDALGGMGLVALKQNRFAQARDLLIEAGSHGDPTKWHDALAAARYFAALQDAQALVTRGQLDAAQKAAEALVRSGYSQSGSAMELLADIYERQGRYADAADLYRQAGGDGADNAQRLQARAARGAALAAAARGDATGAEQAFQQGLQLDANDPWIRYEFARFLIKQGRGMESQSLIDTLAGSSDPDALYAAAMLDAGLGRTALAQGLIDRIPAESLSAPMKGFAVGLKVDSAIARARQIAAQGQKAEAMGALRSLAATRGLAPAKVAAIAAALADMGDVYGAASLAQQALASPVGELAGYDAIVRVAARAGRDDLARTALARASTQAAADPVGRQAVARMAAGAAAITADRLRLQGQLAQSYDVLQAAWATAPGDPDLLAALARLYQQGRMNGKAAQTFAMILARDPHNRDALSGLMETAQAAGDKRLSQQAESDLLQLDPGNYQTWLAAARTEQARGNTGTAMRYFKQARAIYTHADGASGAAGGNPFAGGQFTQNGAGAPANADGNPFRNAPRAATPAIPSPFALGNGTRLPLAEPTPAWPQGPGFAPDGGAAGGGGAGAGGYRPAAYLVPDRAADAGAADPGDTPSPALRAGPPVPLFGAADARPALDPAPAPRFVRAAMLDTGPAAFGTGPAASGNGSAAFGNGSAAFDGDPAAGAAFTQNASYTVPVATMPAAPRRHRRAPATGARSAAADGAPATAVGNGAYAGRFPGQTGNADPAADAGYPQRNAYPAADAGYPQPGFGADTAAPGAFIPAAGADSAAPGAYTPSPMPGVYAPAPAANPYAPNPYADAAYAPQDGAPAPYPATTYPPAPANPAAPYPAPGYPAASYPAAGYGTMPGAGDSAAPSPFGGTAPPAPVYANPYGAPYGAGSTSPGGNDPVLAGIAHDIATMTGNNGPRAEFDTSFRHRSGETGLSALNEVRAGAKLSTGLGRGRIWASAEEVTIDSGRPTGDSLQRFGTDATIEAQAIVNKLAAVFVNAQTQRASGVAVSGGYADKLVQIEAGTTPIGMNKTLLTGSVSLTPHFGDHVTAHVYAERKPVTDSVVSYAGTTDPVTGKPWGRVMRLGGGGGLSYDNNGSGAYYDVKYNHYTGIHVPKNHNYEANVGGYLRLMTTDHATVTVGINANYQKFANNQNEFTYGTGGYFSPQSFFAIGFPLHYTYKTDAFDVKVSATPGFQSFNQAQTNLYPRDPALQAQLNTYKVNNSDVRNYYDTLSKTGFGMSAQASAYYNLTPGTQLGGELSYNTFGSYNELRAMLGIRQSFGRVK